MPTISSIVQDYLTKENVVSLLRSYEKRKMTDEMRSDLMRDFFNTIIGKTLPQLFGCEWRNTRVIGAGTAGFIVGFNTETSKEMYEGFQRFQNIHFDRKYMNDSLINDTMPREMALKVQMFYENKPYFEARALREERIMDKVNNLADTSGPSSLIKSSTPRFYYGCTVNVPYGKDIIKYRLTFIDLIPPRYSTILEILQTNPNFDWSPIFTKIQELVKALWRFGISHNDLSVRNILVYIAPDAQTDIKLVDFGLAELIRPIKEGDDVSMIASYEDLYKNADKSEQNGSNVAKLKELAQYMRLANVVKS